MGYIYLVTNKINGMKYVGQTLQADVNTRWKSHRSIKKRTVGKILHNAYKKYGFDNFIYKIICICFDEDTNKYEEQYIKKYNTVYPNGYNLLQGGNNKRHNEETRRLLSEMNKGEKHPLFGKKKTPEQIKQMSERMKGDKNPCFGKKFTEEETQKRLDRYKEHPETKEQISNSLKEYYKDCYEKGIKTNGKTVKQYDLNGNFIKEYYSISEAARDMKLRPTTISRACERVNGTSGGYRWKKE
jgi:group I intron endonuclease